ncbi:L,D-transpeptidase [Gorillibacterium sp. sgz5001074]|uniref:L,D-transpeptidase n=1 Tax=Gorillibacterium sp. sgz5001074 TaxID=3446695 RepID=UPI003F661BE6
MGSYRLIAPFMRTAVLVLAGLLLLLSQPGSVRAEEEELYVAIHKKRHQLTVVMNDVPVYSFPVATGRGDLTPEGEFRIVTKVYKPFYLRKKIAGGHPDNPLGTRWMGLSVGNGYKYGIHGTNRPWQIGQSASSGCIRMRNKDIEYLFRHIPLRTKVVITDD